MPVAVGRYYWGHCSGIDMVVLKISGGPMGITCNKGPTMSQKKNWNPATNGASTLSVLVVVGQLIMYIPRINRFKSGRCKQLITANLNNEKKKYLYDKQRKLLPL